VLLIIVLVIERSAGKIGVENGNADHASEVSKFQPSVLVTMGSKRNQVDLNRAKNT
jgi:hypothetical protein